MIRPLVVAALLVGALIGGGAPPAGAQSGSGTAPAAAGALPAQASDAPPAGGVQQRATAPRSLRPYWHVFASFAVAWVLLFGYSISLRRRFGRLEETVDRLGHDA